MFLSDRGLFSIDLFLADARTGKVKRQITKTAVDPHYQSLQFIQSAGSWSPDGARFVFAGISAGRPVLSLYDVEREKMERDIRLPSLDEVFNPSWSPDGRQHRLCRPGGRLVRPLRLRSRVQQAEPADERSVCRPAAGLVARWTHSRLCHRPLYHRPGDSSRSATTPSD